MKALTSKARRHRRWLAYRTNGPANILEQETRSPGKRGIGLYTGYGPGAGRRRACTVSVRHADSVANVKGRWRPEHERTPHLREFASRCRRLFMLTWCHHGATFASRLDVALFARGGKAPHLFTIIYGVPHSTIIQAALAQDRPASATPAMFGTINDMSGPR